MQPPQPIRCYFPLSMAAMHPPALIMIWAALLPMLIIMPIIMLCSSIRIMLIMPIKLIMLFRIILIRIRCVLTWQDTLPIIMPLRNIMPTSRRYIRIRTLIHIRTPSQWICMPAVLERLFVLCVQVQTLNRRCSAFGPIQICPAPQPLAGPAIRYFTLCRRLLVI